MEDDLISHKYTQSALLFTNSKLDNFYLDKIFSNILISFLPTSYTDYELLID